jgi:hypothetical protein
MKVADARLPMKTDASELSLNCNSCHSAHRFDIRQAAVKSCLNCHDDQHSKNYRNSAHFALFNALFDTESPAEQARGVSCAGCHMPRVKHGDGVEVEHNQNANLRPNDKMIRSSCINCHSLQFSINALADEQLILNNFSTPPTMDIQSLEMAKKRQPINKEH